MVNKNEPVPIILDTDMGNDIDDALALAMLHTLQDRGECDLRGVVVSKDNPYAAAYVDVINTFYNHGQVPIGQVLKGMTPEDGKFVRQVVELTDQEGSPLFQRTTKDYNAYPSAVKVLRSELAAAADHSLVILMIGFSTNMASLFESGPDEHSDDDGLTLFDRKVRHVVMMGANFSEAVQNYPTIENREYNIHKDVLSARQFVTQCPRPIYFSGFEVGSAILYPGSALETDYRWCSYHPVVEAYKRFLPMPYDRPTWDLTSVLFAVRPERGYFGLSDPGTAEVDEQGVVRFQLDSNGSHRHLTVNAQQQVTIAELQNLLAASPVSSPPIPSSRRTLAPHFATPRFNSHSRAVPKNSSR